MDISDVARRTGLPASTLRFYEKKGLITAVSQAGERRRFAPDVLDQLALIALGQAGGLSLDEISAMLPVDGVLGWTDRCCWPRRTRSTRPSSACAR